MQNLKGARIRTAGAYVSVQGLYPFQAGWKLHNGNIPVIRLGGHVEANETGWECARREVAEEANISIRPVAPHKTYFASGESQDIDLKVIEWDDEMDGGIKPLLVVTYDRAGPAPVLSLMYLAQSNETPTPSAEVKGILLLDPESIGRICRETLTLDRYLKAGGKAVLRHDFDRDRALEPFIQLRILAYLLNQGF